MLIDRQDMCDGGRVKAMQHFLGLVSMPSAQTRLVSHCISVRCHALLESTFLPTLRAEVEDRKAGRITVTGISPEVDLYLERAAVPFFARERAAAAWLQAISAALPNVRAALDMAGRSEIRLGAYANGFYGTTSEWLASSSETKGPAPVLHRNTGAAPALVPAQKFCVCTAQHHWCCSYLASAYTVTMRSGQPQLCPNLTGQVPRRWPYVFLPKMIYSDRSRSVEAKQTWLS